MTLRNIRSTLVVALTASVLFALGAIPSPAAQAACPDGGYTSTPGERIKGPNNATVYLVDPEGYKRPIVSAATYEYFFRDWAGIKTRNDIDCVLKSNLNLSYPSSALVHDGRGSYYFSEPIGTTVRFRWITSATVYYTKYYFRWDSANYADPGWISSHPGPSWG